MADRLDACRRADKWRSALVVGGASCAALTGTLLAPPAPVLLWNASPSSPVGLYWVRQGRTPALGGTAIAWPPPAARRLAAARDYLPADVPLVKNVAGVAGTRICAVGAAVFVNGRVSAVRRVRDGAGRPLPWWSGCHTLSRGELFLLSTGAPAAFDGRYFGITRAGELIGEGELLWPR